MNKTITEEDLFRFLGLCMKAGKLKSGEDQVVSAIRDLSAYLVIVAEDASENSKKLYTDKSSFYKIKTESFCDCISLGRCIGKKKRAALAITDEGFAKAFEQKLLQYRSELSHI